MPFAVVFHLKHDDDGWEERYWSRGATFDEAETHGKNLATTRRNLMGNDTQLIRMSVRTVERNRLAKADRLDMTTTVAGDRPSTPKDVAILIRMENALGQTNYIFMRGCPIAKVNLVNQDIRADGPWDAAFEQFATKIRTNFQLCTQPLPPFEGAKGGKIKAIQPGSDTQNVKIVFEVAQNLNPGLKIKITRGRGVNLPSGEFRVYPLAVPDGVTYELAGTQNPAHPYGEPLFYTRGSAEWHATTPTFSDITSVEAQDVTDRDTGRPFGVPLGRRPVKKDLFHAIRAV